MHHYIFLVSRDHVAALILGYQVIIYDRKAGQTVLVRLGTYT
jgi:hypothetical protein